MLKARNLAKKYVEESDVEEALAAWKAELLQEEHSTDPGVAHHTVFREADLLRMAREAHNVQALDAFVGTPGSAESVASCAGIAADNPLCQSKCSIGVKGCMAQCHGTLGATMLAGDTLVYSVDSDGCGVVLA